MAPIHQPLGPEHTTDIHQLHPHFHSAQQQHHNNTPVFFTPPNDYGEATLEEQVDHFLILLATLLPLLLAISIIAALAILLRRMKNTASESRICESGAMAEDSFSSLPTPSPTPWWREESLSMSKVTGHSVSMPHLLLLSESHSMSLPHLLAIESYYNYPSTASILEETFQDVVDQAKIQAELSSDPPAPPKKLKRSVSLKSLRRLRRRILHILSFRKRHRRAAAQPETNIFNLSTLPVETRQQLKQIYVY